MDLNVSLLMLLVLVARSSCATFGYTIDGEGHTSFETDSEVKMGLAEDPAVIGIDAQGRGGGFFKNRGSVSGEVYASNNDGTGFGAGGTINYDHGVGTDIGGGGTLGLNTDEMKPISKTNGHWDRKVQSCVTGDIDFLHKNELKTRASKRRAFDRM